MEQEGIRVPKETIEQRLTILFAPLDIPDVIKEEYIQQLIEHGVKDESDLLKLKLSRLPFELPKEVKYAIGYYQSRAKNLNNSFARSFGKSCIFSSLVPHMDIKSYTDFENLWREIDLAAPTVREVVTNDPEKLSYQHAMIIHLYTKEFSNGSNSLYRKVNEILRTRKPKHELERYSRLIVLLHNALNQLPPKRRGCWRGMNTLPQDFFLKFKVGNVLTFSSFCSSSLHVSNAEGFMDARPDIGEEHKRVLIRMNATDGKDIRRYSFYKEAELTFNMCSRWKVKKIRRNYTCTINQSYNLTCDYFIELDQLEYEKVITEQWDGLLLLSKIHPGEFSRGYYNFKRDFADFVKTLPPSAYQILYSKFLEDEDENEGKNKSIHLFFSNLNILAEKIRLIFPLPSFERIIKLCEDNQIYTFGDLLSVNGNKRSVQNLISMKFSKQEIADLYAYRYDSFISYTLLQIKEDRNDLICINGENISFSELSRDDCFWEKLKVLPLGIFNTGIEMIRVVKNVLALAIHFYQLFTKNWTTTQHLEALAKLVAVFSPVVLGALSGLSAGVTVASITAQGGAMLAAKGALCVAGKTTGMVLANAGVIASAKAGAVVGGVVSAVNPVVILLGALAGACIGVVVCKRAVEAVFPIGVSDTLCSPLDYYKHACDDLQCPYDAHLSKFNEIFDAKKVYIEQHENQKEKEMIKIMIPYIIICTYHQSIADNMIKLMKYQSEEMDREKIPEDTSVRGVFFFLWNIAPRFCKGLKQLKPEEIGARAKLLEHLSLVTKNNQNNCILSLFNFEKDLQKEYFDLNETNDSFNTNYGDYLSED